jgi:hypothetical protein
MRNISLAPGILKASKWRGIASLSSLPHPDTATDRACGIKKSAHTRSQGQALWPSGCPREGSAIQGFYYWDRFANETANGENRLQSRLENNLKASAHRVVYA